MLQTERVVIRNIEIIVHVHILWIHSLFNLVERDFDNATYQNKVVRLAVLQEL